MAGVVVLDVSDEIRVRLGEPTVTALARRFDADGRCLTCGERLGAAPLSVRAYDRRDGEVTLLACHVGCATSVWVDIGPYTPPRPGTWAAAVTSITVMQVPRPRWVRRLRVAREQARAMPVMLVHPCLETSRVRLTGVGEAVNADIEDYSQLGFVDPSVLAGTWPVRSAGRAWMHSGGEGALLHVIAADRIWSAPVSLPLARLAASGGGVLLGVTTDCDPRRLAADAGYLDNAMGRGDVLLGWAPLPSPITFEP